MKKLLFFLLIAFGLFACNKQTEVEEHNPIYRVTVVATSTDEVEIQLLGVEYSKFDGSYSKTYETDGRMIDVFMYSKEPTAKTIIIYVNGIEVARRASTCQTFEYDLSYDLDWFSY